MEQAATQLGGPESVLLIQVCSSIDHNYGMVEADGSWMPNGASKSVACRCLGILDCTSLLVLADMVGGGFTASYITPFVVYAPVGGAVSFFTVAFGEVSLVVHEDASGCCTSAGPGCTTVRTAWDTDA